MSLYVIATPIGNNKDISLRALDTLKKSDVIIGEEEKELNRFLNIHKIDIPQLELLNEHTKQHELNALVLLCQEKEVSLITDCGTPGFNDPGADLVKACRRKGVKIVTLPGASSLMCLLSLCGERLDRFHFYGFLPQKTEEREVAWQWIEAQKFPVIIMDTPYRYNKTVEECAKYCANKKIIIGCDFTSENEEIITKLGKELANIPKAKREFLIAIV